MINQFQKKKKIEKPSIESYRQLRERLTTTLWNAPKLYIYKDINRYQSAIEQSIR